jgi:hypothetical protein
MRGVYLKKEYYSPEFEYNKIYLNDVICASAETPIIDIIEDDDSDDL